LNREIKMKPVAGNKGGLRGPVYCLICTHTVEADVIPSGRRLSVRRGQKCPRCSSSLDAAYVVVQDPAA
jgi:DNA-directed RNA polymerase subunit RPC12/RpoP